MDDLHPIDRASRIVGSQAALGALLGIGKAAVNQWKVDGRRVPVEHCTTIEKATDKAVMRWDLRPDDWHTIWPELIGTKGAPKVRKPAKAEA